MTARWIIIDGHSLLHHDPAFALTGPRAMQKAREQLVARLSALNATLAERITVVFDGAGFAGQRAPQPPGAIEVIYSTSAQTADSVIERLAHTAARPGEILVVTSDRAERETVDAAGAQTIGCTDFLSQLTDAENTLHRSSSNLKQRAPKSTLGDFFPKT